jgi:hypothetical protein
MANPTPRYHVEEVAPVSPNGPTPLVAYGKRETDGTAVHYSALLIDTRQFPVIYTYNTLTVKADEMVYSTLDSLIHATGHVVSHDGQATQNGSSIQISFDCYNPKIKLEK